LAGAGSLVEGVPAGAGALCLGVVDREPGRFEAIDEVDLRVREVRDAHLVDDDPDPELLGGDVLLGELVVEVHRVAEARAAARLDRHTERDVIATLLLQELLHLARRVLGQLDHPRPLQVPFGSRSSRSWWERLCPQSYPR